MEASRVEAVCQPGAVRTRGRTRALPRTLVRARREVRRHLVTGYIFLTWGVALALALTSVARAPQPRDWAWWGAAALFAAMLAAEIWPVQVPGGGLHSIASVPHVVAVLLLPPWIAAPLAAGAMLIAETHAKARVSRVVFNTANTLLTVAAMAILATALGLTSGDLQGAGAGPVLRLLFLAVVYYGINSLPLSIVVFLSTGRSPRQFFERAWTLVLVEMSAPIIGGLAAVVWLTNASWSPLVVAPAVVAHFMFRYIASSIRKSAQVASLEALGRAVSVTLAPRQVFDVVWRQLRAGTGIQGAFLRIDGRDIDYAAGTASDPSMVAVRKHLHDEVMRWGRARTVRRPGRLGVFGSDVWLAVPIVFSGATDGCFGVVAEAREFTDEDEQQYTVVAEWVSIALEHTRLMREAAEADALRALDAMRNELIAVLSHELRTPLATLVGFSEILLTRHVTDERRREYLTIMGQEAQRLTSLSEQVLDVQRLQAGQSQVEPAPCPLAPIIRRAVGAVGIDELRPISLNLARDLPLVLADGDRIQQVLVNLLNNARKYSPDGGRIRVAVETFEQEVRVCVSDSGLGLPAETLTRLFEKFYRVDSPSHRGIRGTGLGLAIARSIVESHGGRIWAESAGPAKGSRFCFTLPRADVVQPQLGEAQEEPAA